MKIIQALIFLVSFLLFACSLKNFTVYGPSIVASDQEGICSDTQETEACKAIGRQEFEDSAP